MQTTHSINRLAASSTLHQYSSYYLSGIGVNKDGGKQSFDFTTNNLKMVYNSYNGHDMKVKFGGKSELELTIKETDFKLEDCTKSVSIPKSRTTIVIQVDNNNYKVLLNGNEVYNGECKKFKDEDMNENTIQKIAFTGDIPNEACGNYHFISVK